MGMKDGITLATAILSLVVAFLALLVSVYRDVLLKPEVRGRITYLRQYPGLGEQQRDPARGSGSISPSGSLSVAVIRPEATGAVELKHGARVWLKSSGWASALDIEIRARAKDGAVIVQVHTDDKKFVERVPNIARQGQPEVFIQLKRMVPREEVTFTFWYGVPAGGERTPELLEVLVRHTEGMAKLEVDH